MHRIMAPTEAIREKTSFVRSGRRAARSGDVAAVDLHARQTLQEAPSASERLSTALAAMRLH